MDQLNIFTMSGYNETFSDICAKLGCENDAPAWPDDFGKAITNYLKDNNIPKIRTLSLFSGAGGLDIGFHDVGFDIIESVEIEEKFCQTLKLNSGKGKRFNNSKVNCIDIREYTGKHLGNIDFIIGGPPCQTFSAAGRRANGVLGTTDARGVLFREYVRLLQELSPVGFLFENVYGIIGAQGGEAWKENLLLSRFAAPTSAGILFTMLAAAGLKSSWVYKKVQVLAIFDDLDTILLMIPLQIMMVGLRWQLGVIILIVMVLLIIGWRKMGSYDMRQDWKAILFYAVFTCGITQVVYLVSKYFYGEDASIHIEVLLPAFVLGMVMRHKHIDTKVEHNVATAVSFLFMFLVGVSMPVFFGVDFAVQSAKATTITGAQPMMSWPVIILHVVIVSFLSNIGKLFPLFFYYTTTGFPFARPGRKT